MVWIEHPAIAYSILNSRKERVLIAIKTRRKYGECVSKLEQTSLS